MDSEIIKNQLNEAITNALEACASGKELIDRIIPLETNPNIVQNLHDLWRFTNDLEHLFFILKRIINFEN